MPQLYLHIGRKKAGSSSIQALVREHAQLLMTLGIHCPLGLRNSGHHAELSFALMETETHPLIDQFRHYLRSDYPKLFLSTEFFCDFNPTALSRLKRIVSDAPRILYYLRDYPSWIVSLYAQRTKRALNSLDIDHYLERHADDVSAIPQLNDWAQAFSWRSIRVRPLDRLHLAGGDLITDLLSSLGADVESAPSIDPQNTTPHWITLELERAWAIAASPAKVDIPSARLMIPVFERCAAHFSPRAVPYLTAKQWQILADRYTKDVSQLAALTGTQMQAILPAMKERDFLPSIETVPNEVFEHLRVEIERRRMKSRLKPEIFGALEKIASYRQ